MKRVKFIVAFLTSIFMFNINAFAASGSLSVNKGSVYVGDTFTVTVNINAAAAWNVHVSSTGPVSGCSINQADTTADAENTNKSFSATCTATGTGTININLSGDVTSADDGNAVGISGSKSVTVSAKPVAPANTSTPINQNTKSNDNSLKELIIENGKLDFNKDKTDFSIEVPYEVEKIGIKATASNEKATVVIPKDLTLKIGSNSFEIVVTAEDGSKRTYKVNVKRLERVLSSDTTLKSLNTEGYDITFNKDQRIYDLGKINTNKLLIEAIPNDTKATVKIYGDKSIGPNDSVVISVTAENKTEDRYVIYADNASGVKINYTFIYIIIGILILGFMLLLFRGKNKKDKNNSGNNKTSNLKTNTEDKVGLESVNKNDTSASIMIDNKELVLPISYNSLKNIHNLILNPIYENTNLPANKYTITNLYRNYKPILTIELLNDATYDLAYMNCKIVKITQTREQVLENGDSTVLFPKGLYVGMSITNDSLFKLLGKPNDFKQLNTTAGVVNSYKFFIGQAVFEVNVVNDNIVQLSLKK